MAALPRGWYDPVKGLARGSGSTTPFPKLSSYSLELHSSLTTNSRFGPAIAFDRNSRGSASRRALSGKYESDRRRIVSILLVSKLDAVDGFAEFVDEFVSCVGLS